MPPPGSRRFTYVAVYFVLLTLLALTAAVARITAGFWSLPVTLAIATVKVALISWYFMQLRVHRGLVRIFAAAGLFWLGILLVLGFSDYLTRSGPLFF